MNSGSSNVERLRVRMACAGIALALLSACGPGGPKRDTGGNGGAGAGGGTTKATGISIVAGADAAGNATGKGALARFNTPGGIVIDSKGNLFVADTANFVIRKIAADGTVTTFAGTAGTSDYRDNAGTEAFFLQPTALAIDAADNLYVADRLRIRRITPAGIVDTVQTLQAGNNSTNDALNALAVGGVAADGKGNLFVTTGIGTLRFPIANPNNTTALEGAAARNNVPGVAVVAPRGVAVNADSVAWVAGLASANAINRFDAGSTTPVAYAGASDAGSTNDSGLNARFDRVVALALDKNDNLYVADAGNHTVRKITPKLNVTTEAGTAGSNRLATGALPGSLADLRGLAVAADGTLYATSGNAVVKIVLP